MRYMHFYSSKIYVVKINYTIYQKDLTPFKISSKTYLEIAKDDFSNLKAVEWCAFMYEMIKLIQ